MRLSQEQNHMMSMKSADFSGLESTFLLLLDRDVCQSEQLIQTKDLLKSFSEQIFFSNKKI